MAIEFTLDPAKSEADVPPVCQVVSGVSEAIAAEAFVGTPTSTIEAASTRGMLTLARRVSLPRRSDIGTASSPSRSQGNVVERHGEGPGRVRVAQLESI